MIRYRVLVGQDKADTGVWTWKDEEDFMEFLRLMHTKNTPEVYKDSPKEFLTYYRDDTRMAQGLHAPSVPWRYIQA
jgi:hypothetical protein